MFLTLELMCRTLCYNTGDNSEQECEDKNGTASGNQVAVYTEDLISTNGGYSARECTECS